jgi:hypothetical protein
METQEIKHVESNTKIHYTTDYGRFKFLKGNRDINEGKVNKIKKVIQAGIDVLKYAPIIVNEAMEIIDGQHRFAVSREMKGNVYYVIHKEADLSIVPTINSNSSKWRNIDFLNSYADLKKPAYLSLIKFMEEFSGIGLSTAIKIVHAGTMEVSDAVESFRDGVLSNDHIELAHKVATLLNDFRPHMENPFSSRMFRVMLQLMDNGKYDHALMLKKLQDSGRRIENLTSPKTIIQDMESVINHRMKERVIIH